jgi:hypothetical protein
MTGDLKYDDLRVILASSLPSSVSSDFLGFLPVDGNEVRDCQAPNHYFFIVYYFSDKECPDNNLIFRSLLYMIPFARIVKQAS